MKNFGVVEMFEKRVREAECGKNLFKRWFDFSCLSVNDAFILVLTENKECIHYGIKYLSDFIELYHKRNTYVFLSKTEYIDFFLKAGGIVKICDESEMKSLSAYFDVFQRKTVPDNRIVFLTEKDGYGLFVEDLLKKKEFTLEEYVAISLYQLNEIKEKN